MIGEDWRAWSRRSQGDASLALVWAQQCTGRKAPLARLPRLVVPGAPLHLIQRGNNRSATFFAADDYQRYCDALLQASRRFGCAVHAYVLMTYHVHLMLTPGDERGPARMMQAIGR